MNVEFSYTRKRSEFGRPCFFTSPAVTLTLDIPSDQSLNENYVYKRNMERKVHKGPTMSSNIVDMEVKMFETRGMCHTEGGWPREVNPKDEEQTERYRKRIQRDDNYVIVMKKLTSRMERAVTQNTLSDIYKISLENMECLGHRSDTSMNMTHVCRPIVSSRIRNISWRPESSHDIIVTMNGNESLIWNLTNTNKPITITANAPMTCLKYFFNDNRLVSGLESGEIAVWDVRSRDAPVSKSASKYSHRDAVVALLWTASNSEFFTAGSDGMIKWWDCTKLRKPKSEMSVDVPVTCLEYDPNVPSKFLMGTANGQVICGSRRKDGEIFPWRIKVSEGPVIALARNPLFPKVFLSVGDKSVKMWSEDCRQASLFWTAAAPAPILTAQWSPARCSVIACGRLDNYIDVWDIGERRYAPLYSIRNGPNVAVTIVTFQDEGKSLAAGTADGSLYIYQMSKKLATITTEEKSQLSLMIDHNVSREKIAEAKSREMKKKDTKVKQAEEVLSFDSQEDERLKFKLDEIETEYLLAVIMAAEDTAIPPYGGDAVYDELSI